MVSHLPAQIPLWHDTGQTYSMCVRVCIDNNMSKIKRNVVPSPDIYGLVKEFIKKFKQDEELCSKAAFRPELARHNTLSKWDWKYRGWQKLLKLTWLLCTQQVL